MKTIFTLLFCLFLLFSGSSFSQSPKPVSSLDDCDKVQSLLTTLHDFKGELINDNAYGCKSNFILEGFTGARVIVPGKEAKYWTVNMNSDDLLEVEAETMYVSLVQKLARCVFLNSWKHGETGMGDEKYHYNFKQTISSSDHYKSILVSYYKLKNKSAYRVEFTLMN